MLAAAVAIGGVGLRRDDARTTTVQTRAFPTLTSATATFTTLDHGKDADSRLPFSCSAATASSAPKCTSVGTQFDDHASIRHSLSPSSGPFTTSDVDDGQVRLRLAPDGDDDLTFDLHMTLRFSDGTTRNFFWRGIRLDHNSPERVADAGRRAER